MKLFPCIGLAAALSMSFATQAYEPAIGSFDFNRALFKHYSHDHLSAAADAASLPEQDTSTRAFVGDNLLSYGMYMEAQRILRPLLAEGTLSAANRADIWLSLARYEFERGYLDAAEITLTEMRVDVGARRNRTERNQLLAEIQLIKGRASEAIATLTEGRTYAKSEFARYNLAIAFFAAGNVRRGRIEMDKLGRQVVNDPVEHALRDRANLALAYNYLAEAKGASAKPVLQRIRLEGPYSDEALLGMGWAEIAGDKADDIRLIDSDTDDTIGGVVGAILRPGRINDDLRARLGMLNTGLSTDTMDQRFRKALVPWLELDGRDPKKPAVLEVQLAIPYALDAIGEKDRARQFYERAVKRLETGRTGLDKAMEGILSGRMIETMIRRDRDRQAGWNWRLRDLPDAPETYYLAEVLADSTFQEALKNYRDLKQLQRKLASDRQLLEQSGSGANMASVPAEELFRAKLQGRAPLWQGVRSKLKLETNLGRYPRNETLEGLLAWTYRYAPKVALRVDGSHSAFLRGPGQDAVALMQRSDALLQQINPLIQAQRKLLEDIAVAGLQGHKAMLTRYLIDARFALARLYDEVEVGGDR
ncbi:MAG: tetratricopeptide repeat protein [Oceanococcus sp.]